MKIFRTQLMEKGDRQVSQTDEALRWIHCAAASGARGEVSLSLPDEPKGVALNIRRGMETGINE